MISLFLPSPQPMFLSFVTALAICKQRLETPGLTSQRNRGMSFLIASTDLIVFIDDDFIVGDDYFLNIERIFEQEQLDCCRQWRCHCRWCEFARLHIRGGPPFGGAIPWSAKTRTFHARYQRHVWAPDGFSSVTYRCAAVRRAPTAVWLAGRPRFLRRTARPRSDRQDEPRLGSSPWHQAGQR